LRNFLGDSCLKSIKPSICFSRGGGKIEDRKGKEKQEPNRGVLGEGKTQRVKGSGARVKKEKIEQKRYCKNWGSPVGFLGVTLNVYSWKEDPHYGRKLVRTGGGGAILTKFATTRTIRPIETETQDPNNVRTSKRRWSSSCRMDAHPPSAAKRQGHVSASAVKRRGGKGRGSTVRREISPSGCPMREEKKTGWGFKKKSSCPPKRKGRGGTLRQRNLRKMGKKESTRGVKPEV